MNNSRNEKIVVVGFGWVGQANALALYKMGYSVSYYDVAEQPHFHYQEEHEAYARIRRVTSLKEEDSNTTWFIVCVGDRVSEEREQDISLIQEACESLRQCSGKIILRATVLPQKLKSLNFDIYLPEFLHEKNAVEECLTPYYFVVGIRGETALPEFFTTWKKLAYKSFFGTPEEASYIKYLSNIWNAIRIAFVNEIGDSIRAPKTQEDIKHIERILDFVLEQKSYLRYGQAFDGHCLPKDTRAYIGAHTAEGKNLDLLIGAYTSNEHHKKIQEQFKSIPKIYSFWDYTNQYDSVVKAAWHSLNNIRFVKTLRKELRFVMDAVTAIIPERSIEKTAKIWEEKAQELPLYYANQNTKSGKKVSEKEVCETGLADYKKYIVEDPHVIKLAGGGDGQRALDFGCGVGRMTIYLASNFAEVHGLDIAPTMIDVARGRIDDRAVTLTRYDGNAFPYADNFFDFVFTFQTLQYIPSYRYVEMYFKEINRVLRDGGVAKIQLRGGRGVKRWEWSYGATYNLDEALALAERTGFTVLNHQVVGIKHIWLTVQK